MRSLHGLPLGLTQRGCQCVNLPVHVGLGDVIHVDQREPPDAAARQRLSGPRAHTANADHHDMGVKNRLRAFDTIESAQSTKTSLEVGVHSRSSNHI